MKHTLKISRQNWRLPIIPIIIAILCISIFMVNEQTAAAAPAANAAPTTLQYINPDNAKLRDELILMLQDENNRQQLQAYIDATRPVVEKYKSRFESAGNTAMWFEENIPVAGHLIGNAVMSITNYFYQNELKELATSDVAKKFAVLRAAGISIDLNLFQQAVTQYVINKGVDLSLMVDLQELINEKAESVDFIRSVINASGVQFVPLDIGTALPKL